MARRTREELAWQGKGKFSKSRTVLLRCCPSVARSYLSADHEYAHNRDPRGGVLEQAFVSTSPHRRQLKLKTPRMICNSFVTSNIIRASYGGPFRLSTPEVLRIIPAVTFSDLTCGTPQYHWVQFRSVNHGERPADVDSQPTAQPPSRPGPPT